MAMFRCFHDEVVGMTREQLGNHFLSHWVDVKGFSSV